MDVALSVPNKTFSDNPPKKNMVRLVILEKEDIIDNSWTVIRVARKRAPLGWKKVFRNADLEILDVSHILENDKRVNGRFYPDCSILFRAFEITPLSSVRVVIIGQDPYHGSNYDRTPQAQGMSFSVKRGAKIPSSLKNIYKEIRDSYPQFTIPSHGDLTGWAFQGVLLLNSCLTVRPGFPGSHKEIWLGFVKKVINAVIDTNPHCIFVLWGRKAQKVRKMLGERVTVLEAAHPSGYSAHRGFFGCGHFKIINEKLIELGQTQIDWNLP